MGELIYGGYEDKSQAPGFTPPDIATWSGEAIQRTYALIVNNELACFMYFPDQVQQDPHLDAIHAALQSDPKVIDLGYFPLTKWWGEGYAWDSEKQKIVIDDDFLQGRTKNENL